MKFIQRLNKCRANAVEMRQLFNQVLPGRKTWAVNKQCHTFSLNRASDEERV
jgi:hypothetical protein